MNKPLTPIFSSGFTLLEICLAIVLSGICITLAYPSYSSYICRAKRDRAITVLLHGAAKMEQHYLTHHSYMAATREQIFGENGGSTTGYQFFLVATPTTFRLEAINQSRSHLEHCAVLSLDQLGRREPLHCWS